ncbi:MAG: exonuclease SbcCD subunit D [Bdellovibrionota bacterium]
MIPPVSRSSKSSPIRILHTSDWHLGRLLHGHSLLEDQAHALEQLLSLVDRLKPDCLVIAGDIFDRPTPPEGAVRLFDEFLAKTVLERGLKILLIPGNHDSAERVGFASRLLRERGLTIFSKPEDALKPVTVANTDTSVLIYGIPFVEPRLIGEFLKTDVRSPDAAVRALCNSIRETGFGDKPAVLISHAFVVGAETSESERDLYVGGSSHVGADAFEGFAYTALGHLHRSQQAGGERIRYSGSLLHYSKSEIGLEKSITEVRIWSDSKIEIELHPLKPLRALRYIENTLNEVIKLGREDTQREDYIIVGLTDSGPVIDAASQLRLIYPNLLQVSRVGGFLPGELPALERIKEQKLVSELDLFAEFVMDTTGEPMSAPELAAISEIIRGLEVDA